MKRIRIHRPRVRRERLWHEVLPPGPQLIAARSVMGLGAAMTFPATLSLISNVFTGRGERARAIGLWGAIAGVAIALGPIVGGWLLERFSWASIFIAMAPVAAAAAILVALVVPTSKDPDAAALDIPGLVLSSATMALLVFTIIEAPAYGWGAARSLVGFAASAVLLAAFVVRERRVAHPMLDVRLFRNMRFSAASGAVTVSFFTLFGSPPLCRRPCRAGSRRSPTSPSAPPTWPPARSPPSATQPWGWRCSTPPPTRSCAVSPSAALSPAASPRRGPFWQSCSCPPSPHGQSSSPGQ
ncbi:MAG TPA: MFS transporter [Streptosporangiaceae bacterium]|nr:MFS transporter [Streptosporangiaceae bacterium]